MTDETKSPIHAVHEGVKTNLTASSTLVLKRIVDARTEREVERRTAAATSVLEKIEEADRELKKIKPSYVGYSLDGKPIGDPFFTKEQADLSKKTTEQKQKLESALEKALGEGDFSKVLELGGSK